MDFRWDIPTLVAWGISDKYLPQSVAEEFKKANPNVVNLKLIEGAGHMPQEDWYMTLCTEFMCITTFCIFVFFLIKY